MAGYLEAGGTGQEIADQKLTNCSELHGLNGLARHAATRNDRRTYAFLSLTL